jgi:hypothetical protein
MIDLIGSSHRYVDEGGSSTQQRRCGNAPRRLLQAWLNRNLVLFIGAFATMLLNTPSRVVQ